MPIRVLVNGAFGRMGQIATKAIQANTDFELVGQTARDYDLKQSMLDSNAQVVIDFTTPQAVYNNTLRIIEAGVHPVIGTSGLTLKEINVLQQLAAQSNLGGIIAPNFSLGAILMIKYAKEIARYMPQMEILEMHHQHKSDSPSGTAIHMAEMLSQVNAEINQPSKKYHETIPGSRGANHHGIPIHAIRLPGFLAQAQVIFGSPGETLTLKHDSIDRECFKAGICLAAKKVTELKQLIYGLEEVL